MKTSAWLSSLLGALASAQLPYKFSPNTPAVAAEVTQNFVYLDSLANTKASQSALTAVSSQNAAFKDSLKAKLSTADFQAFQRKHTQDSTTLANAGPSPIVAKLVSDTAKALRNSIPANTLDMASVAKRISDTASSLRSSITPRSIGAVPMVGDSVTIPGSLTLKYGKLSLMSPFIGIPSMNFPCDRTTPSVRNAGDVWCYDNSLIFHGVGLASWIGASDIPDKGSKSIIFSDVSGVQMA